MEGAGLNFDLGGFDPLGELFDGIFNQDDEIAGQTATDINSTNAATSATINAQNNATLLQVTYIVAGVIGFGILAVIFIKLF